MAACHRSAGGRWWSWQSWSIQRLRGRPELWTQSRSGRLPTDASTCSLSAWWAGLLGDILATCPKMASRCLLMLSITGRRPVCAATSSLRTWSCQQMRRICRWHFMWKASSVLTSAASSVHVSDAYSKTETTKYYTVTLKYRLRVTQGQWKQNNWIDHIRLSSSWVIWRWILSWP